MRDIMRSFRIVFDLLSVKYIFKKSALGIDIYSSQL